MKNIEIEVRTFISPAQYKNLERKFNKIAKFLVEINDETIYFSSKRDLRIRRDNFHAYLILKAGKIHDDFRDEIEIKLKREDFEKLKDLLRSLGFKIKIVWFRKRKIFDWKGIKVFLDDTKGYGKIIELEKVGKAGEEKAVHKKLENKLKSLGIKITPKEVFDKKFEYYKNNWKKVLKL